MFVCVYVYTHAVRLCVHSRRAPVCFVFAHIDAHTYAHSVSCTVSSFLIHISCIIEAVSVTASTLMGGGAVQGGVVAMVLEDQLLPLSCGTARMVGGRGESRGS